ncbi:MAG: AraC family transcriptional regulator [Lachnospiraceae bacterium]|jgi:AraC-like DNA-binding protein|nr:AraC family transcriptional regulator [Lachnospiraceae bacterium]
MERTIFRQELEGLVMVEQVVREEDYSMKSRHFHDTYELYFLEEGEGYYFIDRETYLVRAGDVVLIKPNQIHKTSMERVARHGRLLLQITEAPMDAFLRGNGFMTLEELYDKKGRIVSLGERAGAAVKELMIRVGEEIRDRQRGYDLMVRLKLLELLAVLWRCGEDAPPEREERVAQSPKYQKVQEVAEYLQANPGTRESLDQLAGRFYISRSWLSRIFREVTGFSVSEYANMVRVKRAQKLLAHGDYSVTEISELVGFESITYFERIFRRYTDRTPLGYRREKRGDIARGRE